MLQAFWDIVNEVIQEENSGFREEISLIKTALDEYTDKLRQHEGLNDLDTCLEAMET